MTEKGLDGVKVRAAFKHVGGEGMAQGMDAGVGKVEFLAGHKHQALVRSTEALNVTGSDIYNLVANATAGVKGNTALAGQVATAYATSSAPPDATKEAIATGLQTAAMNATATAP